MDHEHNAISEMRAIAISREYGRGGGEIAARLAHRLGRQLIDHEFIVHVAEALGVSEATAVVNTGVLDLESVVDVPVFVLERKARRLSTPTGELGPATGLELYPGAPGDFRPPEHMSD